MTLIYVRVELEYDGVLTSTYPRYDGLWSVTAYPDGTLVDGALDALGLNRREANEFIVYWLPQMQGNAYNLISFQADAYTDHARLNISPTPNSVLRVFMAWKGLSKSVEIEPQELNGFERQGFTVVEWGDGKVG